MSDEKKNKKRILFIIIPAVLILIGLGAAGCFLFPKISAKLFPDSALSGETLADDTASASSDSATDAAPGIDANTQKTSAEQTTGTLPETSTPESTVPATGDAGTSAPDETDPGTDAQTTSEADTSAHVTTNPETTGAPETSGAETADTPETRHIHTLGAWTVIRQATCTEEGLKECKCTACGETLTETIAVLSHNYGAWTATRQASCDVDGEQTRTCTKCGHKETKAIPAAGHKWDSGKTAGGSGCSGGTKTYTCTVCGKTRTEVVSGANHTFGDWEWDEYTWTWYENRRYEEPLRHDEICHNKHRTCTKCGYVEKVTYPEHYCDNIHYNEVTHQVDNVRRKDATCISPNETWITCTTCGYVTHTVGRIDPNAHQETSQTIHLTDYSAYTDDFDVVIDTCELCHWQSARYLHDWPDKQQWILTPWLYLGVISTGTAYDGENATLEDILRHPDWQTVIRDFVIQDGWIVKFTKIWVDKNGVRHSEVVDLRNTTRENIIRKYFAWAGQAKVEELINTPGAINLIIDGDHIRGYSISWSG